MSLQARPVRIVPFVPFVPLVPLMLLVLLVLLGGCTGQNMDDQPKLEPYEAADGPLGTPALGAGSSALAPPKGTLPWRSEPAPAPATTPPIPITLELLERGREQYDIFCAPCHGLVGNGDGIIVQRGFPKPISFGAAPMREAPDAVLYSAITDGVGVMYSYGDRVAPADRWAIVGYIRALQRSQRTRADSLPPRLLPRDTQ